MFCAADGQNAAVRMLRSRPDAETCGTTACEAVSEEVIARSAVLTSICEAGGDAMLPGSVTLAGFRIWQNRGYHDPNTGTGRLCVGYQVCQRYLRALQNFSHTNRPEIVTARGSDHNIRFQIS